MSSSAKGLDSGRSPTAIGLIGVGTMGRIILKKLKEKDYEVTASDPVPTSQEFARAEGAAVAATAAEVASRAELVLLSLPGPQQGGGTWGAGLGGDYTGLQSRAEDLG